MKDLFEHLEQLPLELTHTINRVEDNHNGATKDFCEELVIELNKIGYTCDYGLDFQPYNLQKLETTNETPEEMNYNITEQGDNFFINGIEIPNEIFDEEKVEFKIVEREIFIDDLIDWISECKTSDKQLMKDDLKMLMQINDEFILSSTGTNHYLYGNSEEFNNKCEEILNLVKN